MPTFENGWICRECWSANRESDSRCYRCHAVPKIRAMPEPITAASSAEKPPEERTKVTRLTASVPPPAAPAARAPAAPAATPGPKPELGLLVQLRAWFAAAVAAVRWLWRVVRAIPGAPGAALTMLKAKVRSAVHRVTSPFARILAHRRAVLTVGWLISAFSCALLLSAALDGPLAASLVVVASLAIFSGLTAAITSNALERQGRSPSVQGDTGPNASRERVLGAPAEHSTQASEILGGRPAH